MMMSEPGDSITMTPVAGAPVVPTPVVVGLPGETGGNPAPGPEPERSLQETAELHGMFEAVGDPESYTVMIRLLHTATGIDFTHYRSTTIMRRASRRMAMLSQATLAEYAHYLAAVPGEIDILAREILIHVTSFYRDQAVFAMLKSVVFPALTDQRPPESPIRLWIVGCSTGQEVYSLAIELMEHLQNAPAVRRVQIFATDISDWALAKARLGYYPESISEEIPADRLARYFTREQQGYRIIKEIRDLCVFARHDVTADTPFSHIDLISCRNVLIYLGPPLQNQVLPTFHFALKPGGFLLLGTSESLGGASKLYETIDERNRLYRSTTATRTFRQPPLPQPRTGNPSMPMPNPSPVIEMQRAADQIVLGRFAPAGALVTDALEIIQFRGRTNPYLEPAPGAVNLNLLTMVPFAVAEALREALAECRREQRPIVRERVVHARDRSVREITFEVIPIRLPTSSTCFLVLFAEQEPAESSLPGGPLPVGAKAAVTTAIRLAEPSAFDQREALQLRMELLTATAYIHSLTEQLKEAQDEAQANTEEFRSANEELQTTKEEIESTNEELVTINEDLRTANGDIAKAASALRASGEFTSAIVQTMRYPLLVLNAGLRVETANQAFLDAFGGERQNVIGRLVYDLGDGQWDIPELRRLLEDILPNNSAFDDFEVTHDFANAGRKTMLLNARGLHGEDARLRLIVLVIADITERSRIAKDLKDTADDLRRSNAELDQFAAVAAHDLQEPLRMISSYMSMLESKCGSRFDDQARTCMNRVVDGARRMKVMMDAILAYARLGHEVSDVISLDSVEPFRNAVANLKVKIDDVGATINHGALPQVLANREQLTQLFQNLLSNALKYSSAKRAPVIHVSARDTEKEWIFSISDNGIGMDEADHGRIFLLFQRLHTDHQVPGCGIGLAICKKIIEHHAGRIWVESNLDVGSTFFFTLPR